MSDMNDGDSGKKKKTCEGKSGKFYFLSLSLSYSPTGNEEDKSGGERKRRNTETMETEEEVTEIEELELLGGKRYHCIYACLEHANVSDLAVPALIREIDALSRASYLYPNQSTRNHFSKSMPYQLLNHLFILYLSLAGTMVTPYSLQIIPDDEELRKRKISWWKIEARGKEGQEKDDDRTHT